MVRKAVLDDVPAIHGLVEGYALEGVMLHRPVSEISEMLRDFFVYGDDGNVLGAAALHICSSDSSGDMAEIRSLAVREDAVGRGIGTALVAACLNEALSLGLKRVFALTYKTGFFTKMGFKVVDKQTLPHKIWQDCVRCAKFPWCDENAVIIELRELE
ncbi:MAG: N-acetyltransferase [Deltaproteobacteria bacterium]|nr:N-acetyltransferase [Deltaproteobacteria bacterium]